MKPMNIDELTEAELIDLNHRIVERLRFLNQMKTHADMMTFRIGDRVTFQTHAQNQVEGIYGLPPICKEKIDFILLG